MTRTNRTYTPEEKEEAVTLALTLGENKAAAAQLGIPRETVDSWVRKARRGVAIVAPVTLDTISSRLTDIVGSTLEQLDGRARDPRTQTRDLIQLADTSMRAAASAAQMAAAQAAAEVDRARAREFEQKDGPSVLSYEEQNAMWDWIRRLERATDAELEEYLLNGGLVELRDRLRAKAAAGQGEATHGTDG